jgi:hypothetical protein
LIFDILCGVVDVVDVVDVVVCGVVWCVVWCGVVWCGVVCGVVVCGSGGGCEDTEGPQG